MRINPEHDLVLERVLRAPTALVWRCWSEPALFCQWYMPKPWKVSDVVLDLRPGGRFGMVMNGPEGQRFAGDGCFLQVETERLLVFTDLMGEDFAPFEVSDSSAGPSFCAIVSFTPEGKGTRYRFVARHRSPADRAANLALGFEAGLQAALGQLDDLAAGL